MNARIDISPEGCAARTQRIEAAVQATMKRQQQLSAARALVRSAQIINSWELLAAIENIVASVDSKDTFVGYYAKQLLELATDLDAELTEGDPEAEALPYSGRERGELDAQTVGVRGRGVA